MSKEIKIIVHNSSQTVEYAASELAKYLGIISCDSEIITTFSYALKAKAEGDMKTAGEYWKITEPFAFSHEDILQPVFDVFDFTRFTGGSFKIKGR